MGRAPEVSVQAMLAATVTAASAVIAPVAVADPIDEVPTITYSLKAQGLPLSSVNISYLGDDDQPVTEDNVSVAAGFTWTRTARVKGTPSLTVSATSPGLSGLSLDCRVSSTAAHSGGGTSPNRSGTITFAGGLAPAAAKSCG